MKKKFYFTIHKYYLGNYRELFTIIYQFRTKFLIIGKDVNVSITMNIAERIFETYFE